MPYTIPYKSGRVAILSDVHIDSYERAGDDFVTAHGLEAVIDASLDALIIAGDLTNGPALQWIRGLNQLTRHIAPDRIYVFPGNHDYYGGTLEDDDRLAQQAQAIGVHFVQKSELRHGDTRFLCCTLWTDFELLGNAKQAMDIASRGMQDYVQIWKELRTSSAEGADWKPSIEKIVPEDTLAIHREHSAWLEGELRTPHFAEEPGPTVNQRNGEGGGESLFDHFGVTDDDREAEVEFYKHHKKWSNRMILGDGLQVMASLAEREGLKGQVQAIYIDPPYGIKFNSNFQWSTTSRDVKDGKLDHLTREPEQVKAFRDTWRDGIHSYLQYLRDRLVVSRELLTESGSCFVQIGDENVHRVRALMDEVFGEENYIAQISFAKTSGSTADFIGNSFDFVVWYSKDKERVKYRKAWLEKKAGAKGGTGYRSYRFGDI